jgi:prepilin-type N-terminal cleavage/methylation domain-containing protein
MNDGKHAHAHARRARGFTLVELLVVILIILLVSAVTLPLVIPAISNRQMSEAARILQGGLVAARDSAIRNNAPRGIRLLSDPAFNGLAGAPFACNRFIPIEPAPDLTDDSTSGSATFINNNIDPNTGLPFWSWDPSNGGTPPNPPPFPFPFPVPAGQDGGYGTNVGRGFYPYFSATNVTVGIFKVLVVQQAVFVNNMPTLGPNPPTSWFWNVRIGDRFRFNDSGRYYTVVGPMTIVNPEFFVNDGVPGRSSLVETYYDGNSVATTVTPEYLFLVNGIDDNVPPDGYIDNGVNGANDNLDYYDSGSGTLNFNTGIPAVDNIQEWTEVETYVGAQAVQQFATSAVIDPNTGTPPPPPLRPRPVVQWTIARRPVPAPSAQEVSLPAGAVIDLTTWDSTRERSRLPIDPNSGFVDIMLNQSGQVVPTTAYSNPGSISMDSAFYHFWISDRTDVYAPGITGATIPTLPIPPPSSTAIVYTGINTVLKKERQLVTLYTRSGHIVTNSIENFDYANAYGISKTPYDVNLPYDEAQSGMREAK